MLNNLSINMLEMEDLIIAGCFVIAVLAIGYGFLIPYFSGNMKGEKRMSTQLLSGEQRRTEMLRKASNARRGNIDEVLKELDKADKNQKNPPLSIRLEQAGLDWDKSKFISISLMIGAGSAIFTFLNGSPYYIALGAGIISGLGTPRFILNYLKNRRIKAFTEALPSSIDIIVRGVKAGLPINDSIRIVANEAKEPVRSEFMYIVELQQMGLPLAEAVQKLPLRMPTSEANFFAIAVTIQQKAGGSIAEILGNLSKVLRERKKLKNRIQALSQEAKMGAIIIASLPIALALFLMVTSPQHMSSLFNTQTGNMMLVGSGMLMALGVFIMRRMIDIKV
jgi:tight adherence protein B